MPIFTRSRKSHKQDLQKSRTANNRPKLYVLASNPSDASRPESAEWTIKLCVTPVIEHDISGNTGSQSSRSHSMTNLFHSNKQDTTTTPANDKVEVEPVIPKNHYFFSRLLPLSHSETAPTDVVLQIFLTSFPTTISSTRPLDSELVEHFSKTLESVHLTPDPSSWLRQALYALQVAEIIPPVSHGMDINKFMSFATSYLAQHLQAATSVSDETAKEVNYSKILRENERLKQMFTSGSTDYAVVNAANEKSDELGADEDVWNLPVRGKPTKVEKPWGGFWVTHGAGATTSSSYSRDRTDAGIGGRRDVYGGLM